jgi:hypothetical protein
MPREISLGKEWRFDRMVIITGVGRSGTSLLAKLIGSMENTVILYEPAITKFMLRIPQMDKITRSVLMEDYFLPMIIGRNVNRITEDESWRGNFWLSGNMRSRKAAIRWIDAFDPTFIIKTLETQPLIRRMGELFPGCKVIHIIRNGNNVIGSTLNRGWYTDEWLSGSIIDHVARNRNCNIPWYVPARLHDFWLKSDAITRIAFVWAYLVRAGERNNCINVRYEDVLTMPDMVVNRLATVLNLRPTDLTNTHKSAVLGHPERVYHDFSENIAESVRSYYLKTMKMLNYG